MRSRLQSARAQRRIFWVALLVLVAGGVASAIAFTAERGDKTPQNAAPNAPIKDVSKVPKTVKLDPEATAVAREFVLTAVARKNLKRAYSLAGPQIRQGQTLKQWLTGNIAVIPYPIDQLYLAPMKVDYSYPHEALLEVALLPKSGTKIKGQIFAMLLDKVGNRWVVNSWVPHGKPPVRCGVQNC